MGFVVVEVSLELPQCLVASGSEESILHSPSLDHVEQNQENLREEIVKKW